jgi:cytoskeleton protein RodZ
MANFGNSFKKARESKGLTVAQIADETRISARFLEAIENEDFQLLPGGIFNRGFIRTYAARLGLDAVAAVKEYEQLLNIQQPEQAIAPTTPPPRGSTPDKRLYPVAIGVLALAVIIFYAVSRETTQTEPVPVTTAPPVAITQETASTPLTPSVSAASEPESIAAPTSAMTLDIQAIDQTWIKVDADGTNVLPGEILEPGMTRHFNAENSFHLVIGNAGGLNLKLNDQRVKTIGKTGQVRAIVLTPNNLKDYIE